MCDLARAVSFGSPKHRFLIFKKAGIKFNDLFL